MKWKKMNLQQFADAHEQLQNTTGSSGMTAEMKTFYEKRQIDQKRRDYYQYYSGNEWGNPRNYHLSLNSGKLGIERCVDIIMESLKLYEQ